MLILRAAVWCIGRVEIEQNPRPRWVGSLLDDGGPTFGAALLECSPVLDGGDVASCGCGPVAGVTQYGLPCCGCGLGTWRDRMIRLGWSAAVSPPASAESGPRRSARPSREPSGARAARETGPARVWHATQAGCAQPESSPYAPLLWAVFDAVGESVQVILAGAGIGVFVQPFVGATGALGRAAQDTSAV
jgi:hypothetical protein